MEAFTAAQSLPAEIRREIEGYRLSELYRRQAPSRIYMVDDSERRPLILKVGRQLSAEGQRIAWLQGKLPVPDVVAFSQQDGMDYLLMTRLDGVDGTDAHERMGGTRFIEALACGLREVHSIPVANCPYVSPVDDLMDIARTRLERGELAGVRFPPGYLGQSAEDLFESLCRLQPSSGEMVFTHGDASLPNFLFSEDRVSGYIDLGLAAVCDPYQDLGIVARSITRNIGGRWVRPFFEAYGAPLDESRIEFFILLDELRMARPD